MMGIKLRTLAVLNKSLSGAPALLIGSIFAQAITFFASPILTRLYSSSEMGVFAIYTATMAIAVLISTGRYDFAVVCPSSESIAKLLVKLVNTISLAVLVIGLVCACVWGIVSYFVRGDFFNFWAIAIPMGVHLSAVQLGYVAYLMRRMKTLSIALVRVVMAVSSSVLAVVFGYLGFGLWGLLIASLIALAVAALLSRKMSGADSPKIGWRRLIAVARRYKDYPRFDLPSSLFGVIGGQLPALLLGGLFGTSFLGFYALVDRVLIAPLNIIGSAVGSIYRVRATKSAAEQDDFRGEFVGTFLLLLLPAVVFFLPLLLFGEIIFSFVFGDSWRTAGEIAQTLAPLYFVRFIVSPLSMSLYVRNKMKFDMKGQILLLLTATISMLVGWILNDQWIALQLMVALNSVLYLVYFIFSFHIAGKSNTQQCKRPQ